MVLVLSHAPDYIKYSYYKVIFILMESQAIFMCFERRYKAKSL
jgi:hypothetical protein